MEEGGLSGLFVCNCELCLKNKMALGPAVEGYCRTENRSRIHRANIFDLIKGSPIVTLIVGNERARFSCHKTLLSFYSTFFDTALYGTSKKANLNVVVLREENENEMSIFVSWLYTGILNSEEVSAVCASWVLGDKLGAPSFSNDVMYSLGEHYDTQVLDAATAKYVYSNTTAGSKLRSFTRGLIKAEGPFATNTTEDWDKFDIKEFQAAWVSLLREGGDLVTENISSGFGRHFVKISPPWSNEKISKCLVAERTTDREEAKAWHREKMVQDRERRRAVRASQDLGDFTDITSTDDDDDDNDDNSIEDDIASRYRRHRSAPL